MKNYKTIIAMVAAGMALVATERSAEATLTSLGGTAYLTEGNGSQPDLQVSYLATEDVQTTIWTYSYSFLVGALSGQTFTPTSGNPVTSFSVAASYVNAGSLTSADSVTGAINSGFVDWIYSGDGVNSDTVTFTSAYGPALGIASGNDGSVSWNSSNPGGEQVLVPVPEASTVMAGALMLLPFGIGAVRSLRKERVS